VLNQKVFNEKIWKSLEQNDLTHHFEIRFAVLRYVDGKTAVAIGGIIARELRKIR
jgi:hypothetical protein